MIHPNPVAIMVVGSGQEALLRGPNGPTELAARRLARALALPHRPISDPLSPDRELQQLQASGEGWLASLPLDPGQALPDGSTWAEALGAWCQPTLVTLGAQQLSSGAAASSTALLRQWRVPLLGLVQWGGAGKATFVAGMASLGWGAWRMAPPGRQMTPPAIWLDSCSSAGPSSISPYRPRACPWTGIRKAWARAKAAGAQRDPAAVGRQTLCSRASGAGCGTGGRCPCPVQPPGG